MEPSYSIRAVAEETGLSAHTIRAWERRYGVPSPMRTGTNRRVYGAEDVKRLKLLGHAVAAGHSIGLIAGLSPEELQELGGRRDTAPSASSGTTDYAEECFAAMFELDALRFESALVRATAVLGVEEMLSSVVVPVLERIDRGWTDGSLRIAHEHMASAVLKVYLESVRFSLPCPPAAPRLVVTTPCGQLHEIGALMAAITATIHGWSATYLGPNLPAQEIALAVERLGALAVALSIVHPSGDPGVVQELRVLRRELGPDIQIMVGGRAAPSYADALQEIGAHQGDGLSALRSSRSVGWSHGR